MKRIYFGNGHGLRHGRSSLLKYVKTAIVTPLTLVAKVKSGSRPPRSGLNQGVGVYFLSQLVITWMRTHVVRPRPHLYYRNSFVAGARLVSTIDSIGSNKYAINSKYASFIKLLLSKLKQK